MAIISWCAVRRSGPPGASFGLDVRAGAFPDPQAQPRQARYQLLLIDLKSPGIRIRPIRTIADDDEFSEVFFDDVIVPAENLVGKLHDGWRIANALLGHERLGTSNPQFALIALERIKTMARASGIIADPAFQDRLAAASINVTALSAMFSHAVRAHQSGEKPGTGILGGQDFCKRSFCNRFTIF